jgi:uncharacterized delta-60 repeat protein
VPTSNSTNTYSFSLASSNAIALQNGQVVEVGSLTSNPASISSMAQSTSSLIVARLNSSGLVDSTFGSGGTTTIPVAAGGVTYNVTAEDIAVQSSGKIDVLGIAVPPISSTTTTIDLVVAQLTSTGSLDTSFGTSGIALFNFGTSTSLLDNSASMALGPDGKIDVAAGAAVTTSTSTIPTDVFAVARLTTGGALDTTFNNTGLQTVPFSIGGMPMYSVMASGVVVQPNDSIVVVGSATPNTATPPTDVNEPPTDIVVARLTSGGSLDPSFNGTGTLTLNYGLGGSSSADTAAAVALSGSQIVIVGTSNQVISTSTDSDFFPSISALTVTRLNTNGSFDTTFNGSGKFLLSLSQAGTTFNTTGSGLIVNSDGSLLVGGSASEQNGNSGPSGGLLASVTSSGALNPSYGSNGTAIVPDSVQGRMLQQADGKVVYVSYSYIDRTTAPVPAVVSTTIVTTGTGKKAKASGVTLTLNTAINPALISNLTAFTVRPMKGKKAIKIKKGGIVYNAATQTLTITFAKKTKVGPGFQVLIMPGGVVAADGQILFNGAVVPILITPTV